MIYNLKFFSDIKVTYGEDFSDISQFDILIGAVRDDAPLHHSKNLKKLIIPWAGLPQVTAKVLKDFPDIEVHNIHHNATVTAEMTFTLMITAMKRIIPIDRDLRNSNWERRYNDEPIIALENKHAVVLGYGTIGSQVAKYCKAFKMNVSVVSRTKKEIENSFTIDKLEKLLPKCDALLITLPLTPGTEGLISKEMLAQLPDNCTLVNISRGKVVDEEALYNELKSGRIRAGIDVWYKYPFSEEEQKNMPVSDYPFHELDNVVMTPHLAGHSMTIEKLRSKALAKLLNQAANGEQMDNRIDLSLGY